LDCLRINIFPSRSLHCVCLNEVKQQAIRHYFFFTLPIDSTILVFVMKNNNKISKEQIEQAQAWLKAARRDYRAYLREVRVPWFPLVCLSPDEPQVAINHLQQCVEKIIKALAISSGGYVYHDLVTNFSHDSLDLYLDICLKFINTPLGQVSLNTVSGKIFEQSKAELYNHDEAVRRFNELRTNAKLGSVNKEMKEWAFQFATLPKEQISKMVNSQVKSLRYAKIGAFFIRLIPMWILQKVGIKSNDTFASILSDFEKRGFLLSDQVRELVQKDEVTRYFNSSDEEKRLSLINHFGDILVFACVFGALLVLAAVTYTHAVAPRYPGDPHDLSSRKHKLDSESYTDAIGITGSILNIGKLTATVLKASDRLILNFGNILILSGSEEKETNSQPGESD
jgi:hypothetical protein